MNYNIRKEFFMAKYKAIPQGYMTVGEVAKKMGLTIRALQYYDREGLFSPSCISEGGRRLYSNKDIVKLHQILTLKSLPQFMQYIAYTFPATIAFKSMTSYQVWHLPVLFGIFVLLCGVIALLLRLKIKR